MTNQKQSRGKRLLSNPSLLTSVQVSPLPISQTNKISCKNSEANYRTEDRGGQKMSTADAPATLDWKIMLLFTIVYI